MKLILTEHQYRLIELLNEAVSPISTKINKGGYIKIISLSGTKKNINTLKIEDVYGSGKYIQLSAKSSKYIMNVSASFNESTNSFTLLEGGEYKAGYKDSSGKLHPESIVGGVKRVIGKVLEVDVMDSGKNVLDKVYSKLGKDTLKPDDDDDSSGDVEDEILKTKELEDKERAREKRVFDMIMNDPTLKKAFYHQPKILKGLLNFGRAKGIKPAQDLINKYITQKSDDTTSKSRWSEFKSHKPVTFEVLGSPIRLSSGSDDFSLLVGKVYKGKYIRDGYMTGKHTNIDYKIFMKENPAGDIYRGTIKVFFKGEDDTIIDKITDINIKIRDYIVK